MGGESRQRALLGKMNAVIATEGKDPNVSTGDLDPARMLKAACLACMGKKQRRKRCSSVFVSAKSAVSSDGWMRNWRWWISF